MLDDFRTRIAELRQEMERLTGQAEELERIVREQQAHLEELELQVRQRDEQLAEQQALLEQMERDLRERTEQLEAARLALDEREEAVSRLEQELEEVRAQLAQREATEAVLREELARATVERRVPAEEATLADVMERVVALEQRLQHHEEMLARLEELAHEGVARITGQLEAVLALPRPVPAREVVSPAAVAPEVVEAAPAPVAVQAVAVPAEQLAPAVEVAEGMQAILWEALENLPRARVAGFAGRDGLAIEIVSRAEAPASPLLEVELADLIEEASGVAGALGTGPVLTLAFQAHETSCLVSPVGPDYFAFLLAPSSSIDDLRYAQAVLLQAASRLSELC
ncbi:MAG: hypothetical protein ACP5SI_09045 [Chloroflexia bacterium]